MEKKKINHHVKSYKAFFKGIEYIENEVIRFYNCGEFREEYYPYYKEESFNEELLRVNTIEDIYPYIEDKKVSIYRDGYGVAFKLKFGWMALMSRRVNIFDEDGLNSQYNKFKKAYWKERIAEVAVSP